MSGRKAAIEEVEEEGTEREEGSMASETQRERERERERERR